MGSLIVDLTCRNLSAVVSFSFGFKLFATVLVWLGHEPVVFFS